MAEANFININGEVSKKPLPENIFGCDVSKAFLNEVLKGYLKKNITASTKTRAEVSGGGRKPWRQKGTGRARAGSNRSPLWRKGGVIFGPKPRKMENNIPKKKRHLALIQTLSLLSAEGKVFLAEIPSFKKTKESHKWVEEHFDGLKDILMVVEKLSDKFTPFRNLKNVFFKRASDINAYDLINRDAVVFTDGCEKILEKK